MSEVDARPPATRGRSSHRGGRGGFGRGGPRGSSRKPTNGTTTEAAQLEESFDDQGELGEMKKKYASELVMLKDMFPDWTNDDLVFALQEADGDVPGVVDRITQGNVSQFSEVKSAKDRARSKVKEPAAAAGATVEKPAVRGGRGRGSFEGTRGARGRGSDRGRGGFRGGRGGHATTNGASAAAASVPTTEAAVWAETTNAGATENSWDTAPADSTKEVAGGTWDTAPSTTSAVPEAAKSSVIPDGGAKKTWASMLAPKPAPVPAKKAPAPEPVPVEVAPPAVAEPEKSIDPAPLPPAPAIEGTAPDTPSTLDTAPPEMPPDSADGEALAIVPSKDPLTEENLEHLPDNSTAPATQTVASTTGSIDPRNLTPLPGQQAPIGRPPAGGYAATAWRATGQPGRSASFQRRVQEQQEAVVMPGHGAVDRAAVQFGSMGLNGEPGPDVDEDREEPETRQAPQHSPPAQPRTSLPPAPRHMATAQDHGMPEALPTPKQAPGLPPASQQNQQQMQEATLAPGIPNEPSQMSQNYNHYGRYGHQGMQPEAIGQPQQKPHDPFSQQVQQSSYDHFGSQGQQAPQEQAQQQSQSGFGGLSSAADNYSNYYTADHPRNAYSQYYGGGYGPQDVRSQVGQGQQDAGMGQQRSASGFGAGPNESAFSSQAHPQVSILPSLQQLSAQLNTTIDAHERQRIIEQIQHVISVSSVHSDENARIVAQPIENCKVHGNSTLDAMRDGRLEKPMPAPTSLVDVTNRKPPTPSTVKPKPNAPKTNAKQHPQSRFADSTNSGHNTPHPGIAPGQPSAPSAQQSQHSMHQAPGSQQQQQSGYGSGSYPYGHPSYNSPYAMAYQQQFTNYGGYSGYGGGYGNKQQGMYGGSHGYGMGPQSSFDQHSASPANAGAFGQNQQASMRNVSGMSGGFGGLEDYTRGSSQATATQQHNSSGFGNATNDPFARSTSGFGSQNTGYGQQSMAGQEDSLKPFADASKTGPSPALGQPGRPTSAANSAGGSAQSGHAQQAQSHQSGFGGYGGFQGQPQYGGLGGLGSQQQPGQSGMGGQQGGYGSYGAGGFGQSYGSYNSRGGWGAQYGAH